MSRQITDEIVRAFMNGENKKKSNSEVKADCTGVRMYLFGNLIAERVGNRIRITMAGYPTTTTRERLNGIPGVSLTQKNYKQYLNGKEIKTDEFYINN
jgi:hypothetical protein